MMKKSLAYLLCIVMVLTMTACGTDVPKETPQAAGKTETTSADTAAEIAGMEAALTTAGEPKYIDDGAAKMTGNVRLLTAFKGSLGTDDLIAAFNEYYPNVTVTYDVYTNNPDGNLSANTSIQAGNTDVILSFGTHNTAFRWENGMLMDITDRLAADGLDLKKEWGTDAYKYNDRVYCFPSGGLSVFVAINMEMWNAAGLGEIPSSWTYEEYLEACRKLTQKDASGAVTVYGGTDFNQRDYWTYSMRQTKGVDAFYNADGQADFTSGLAETILQRELDAEAEGIWYSKIDMIKNSAKARDLLWSSTTATCIESIITRFVMDKENYPHDFILGYAPYPVNQEGETNYALGNMPNSFYCVTNNAKDQDAAYAFAKFASTLGGKYLYEAGHTTTWSGTEPDGIVELVFGNRENAEKYVDVDSYIANVLAVGQPAYHEENIIAYSDIASLVDEYTDYILSGEMGVKEGLERLNEAANQAIADAE